jgi:hypothetical protein
MGSSYEALKNHALGYQLRLTSRDYQRRPKQHWDLTFKFSNTLLAPSAVTPSAESLPNAESVLFSAKLSELRDAPHTYGPSLGLEYRPARGREVSLSRVNAGFFWDYRFSESTWSLSQVFDFNFRDYYQSFAQRKDYELSYTANLSAQLTDFSVFRLSLRSVLNVSSVPASYQFNSHDLGLSLSAYF